jgi:hypothetical protein
VLNSMPGKSSQTAYIEAERRTMPGATSAADVATVETVSVDLVDPGASDVGFREQVGGLVVAGVTAHVRSIVALSPPPGVTVTVAVAEPPAETVGLDSVPVFGSVKSAPTPERSMACGLPDASSVTMRTALRVPAADGEW